MSLIQSIAQSCHLIMGLSLELSLKFKDFCYCILSCFFVVNLSVENLLASGLFKDGYMFIRFLFFIVSRYVLTMINCSFLF